MIQFEILARLFVVDLWLLVGLTSYPKLSAARIVVRRILSYVLRFRFAALR